MGKQVRVTHKLTRGQPWLTVTYSSISSAMVSLSNVILAFIFFPSHLDQYLFTYSIQQFYFPAQCC